MRRGVAHSKRPLFADSGALASSPSLAIRRVLLARAPSYRLLSTKIAHSEATSAALRPRQTRDLFFDQRLGELRNDLPHDAFDHVARERHHRVRLRRRETELAQL